jgi:PTH1 family peptidyl-tRNA hydrolase
MGAGIHLIVGLGNPGPRYVGNRHNFGALVVDELAARAGSGFASGPASLPGLGGQVLLAAIRLGVLPGGIPGPKAVLVKPQSYMNRSGGPVAAAAAYFGAALTDLFVVHDDLDLPMGVVRLKRGGGEGGHNGLRDISRALNSRDYVRIRCGIGRPPKPIDPADYVLRDFSPFQQTVLARQIDQAADAVTTLVQQGLAAAQLVFHSSSAADKASSPEEDQ